MSLWGLADTVAKALLRIYYSATALYSATPTLDTEAAVDVSSIVPTQAVAIIGAYDFTSGVTATVLQIYQATGEASDNKKIMVGGVASVRSAGIFIVALDSARKFYIKETGAAVATTLKWIGWFEKGPLSIPQNISQF